MVLKCSISWSRNMLDKFFIQDKELLCNLDKIAFLSFSNFNVYKLGINLSNNSNSLLNKSQTQSQNSMYTDISNLLKTCNSLKALRDEKKFSNPQNTTILSG